MLDCSVSEPRPVRSVGTRRGKYRPRGEETHHYGTLIPVRTLQCLDARVFETMLDGSPDLIVR